jgi:hypothetical protein
VIVVEPGWIEVISLHSAGLSSGLASRALAADLLVSDLHPSRWLLDEVQVPVGMPLGAAVRRDDDVARVSSYLISR